MFDFDLTSPHAVKWFKPGYCLLHRRRHSPAHSLEELGAEVRRRARRGIQQAVGTFVGIGRRMLMYALDGYV